MLLVASHAGRPGVVHSHLSYMPNTADNEGPHTFSRHNTNITLSKIYVDTMHMPASGGFRYIVQGCCLLMQYLEFHMLREEKKVSIANWLYQDIMCRWGSIQETVTDNAPVFIAAIKYLIK
jgi:hypothetical protein